jgi:hypothetical protein
MERLVTVEFGPSRSKRFGRALGEARDGLDPNLRGLRGEPLARPHFPPEEWAKPTGEEPPG